MKDGDLRSQIVRICWLAQARGLVVAADGNFSARTERGTVLITPAGVRKEDVRERDLLEIALDGRVMSGTGRPSSEFRLHTMTYQAREDVRAVCHVHPCVSVALTIGRIPLRCSLLPKETLMGLVRVPVVPYARPGSVALAKRAAAALKNANGVLLARHGSVTVGEDIAQAYSRAEKIEQVAMISLTAGIAAGLKRCS
jgi:L-fuculose-phosphate aldolase